MPVILHSPRNIKRSIWLTCLGLYFQSWCSTCAQNFTLQIADPDPLGVLSVFPKSGASSLGLENGIKGDFGYGVAFDTVYNSNFFLDDEDPESEVTANFLPWISYGSDPEGGARITLTANYQPVYRKYFENPEFNGLDNNADASIRIEGAKTLLSAYLKYTEFSGTDRLSGGFSQGTLVNTGIQTSYQIAPRTSIYANLTGAVSDYGTSSSEGADIYTAEIGSLWAATARLNTGPSLRRTVSDSDNIGSREAWALSMQAEYTVGERIRFNGSIGAEYALYSGDGEEDTVGLTGSLDASYVINDRWVWSSTVEYVTVPSPIENGYVVNNLLIKSIINRSLLRANLGFGMEYNLSDYQRVDTLDSTIEDEHNLSLFIAYNRNIISERIGFESKLSYTIDDGQEEWTQFQLSLGISVEF